MQVGEEIAFTHGDLLAVEAILLGRQPTVVAHTGPVPPGVAAMVEKVGPVVSLSDHSGIAPTCPDNSVTPNLLT